MRYKDARGTARITHCPDLGLHIGQGPYCYRGRAATQGRHPAARRTRDVRRLTQADGPLAGVIYITDRPDVAAVVTRVGDDSRLLSPELTFRTISTVVEQTRDAAPAASRTREAT